MINWLSNKIDYKKESASPPPQELWKFILWSCGGTWKFIFLGAAASTLAGSFEMITTIALGWVVDAAQVAGDRTFFFNINKLLLFFCVLIFIFFIKQQISYHLFLSFSILKKTLIPSIIDEKTNVEINVYAKNGIAIT